jgi:hypothetical protein
MPVNLLRLIEHGEAAPEMTLSNLALDYVAHLERLLKQLLERPAPPNIPAGVN